MEELRRQKSRANIFPCTKLCVALATEYGNFKHKYRYGSMLPLLKIILPFVHDCYDANNRGSLPVFSRSDLAKVRE